MNQASICILYEIEALFIGFIKINSGCTLAYCCFQSAERIQ